MGFLGAFGAMIYRTFGPYTMTDGGIARGELDRVLNSLLNDGAWEIVSISSRDRKWPKDWVFFIHCKRTT